MGELILTALYELYERLVADPGSGIARFGYSEESAVVSLEIAEDGRILRAVPLGTSKGKRITGRKLKVPEHDKRTSGDHPYLLSDGPEYILGVDTGTFSPGPRASRRRDLSRRLHQDVLGAVNDDGARAVLAFFSRPTEELLSSEELRSVRDVLGGGNIVFQLAGDECYIHERPAVARAWESYRASQAEDAVKGQCLVTGEWGPVARLHMSTSGVRGAQPTGGSIVSFNFPSLESYGKEQGQNAPVSERAAFAYGTALNWLTSHERHRVYVGDSTVVFWAERAGVEEDLLAEIFAGAFGGGDEQSEDKHTTGPETEAGTTDESTARRMKSILEKVFRGEMPSEGGLNFDEGVRFYILGLSPNKARLAVRFWNVSTFGEVIENLRRHFEDLALVHREGERPPTVPRLLKELTPPKGRKVEAIPKVVIGSLMRSILEGTPYPESFYALILSRIRVDSNDPNQPRFERKVSYPRAAYVKAHLRRKARVLGNKRLEEGLTEVLNTENKDPGYLLGRLFALLEKAQQDANPGIKATIKDRYYASASATPASVFPVLMRLVQHHLAKSEYGGYVDKLIENVVADIDAFPKHLTLDQQGLFALGYYQQKAALYEKPDQQQKGGDHRDESN